MFVFQGTRHWTHARYQSFFPQTAKLPLVHISSTFVSMVCHSAALKEHKEKWQANAANNGKWFSKAERTGTDHTRHIRVSQSGEDQEDKVGQNEFSLISFMFKFHIKS